MPCTDGGPSYSDSYYAANLEQKLNKVEAMLCAVLTVLEGSIGEDAEGNLSDLNLVLKLIDYKEAGFTKTQLVKWWNAHQEKDRLRREAEAAKKQAERDAEMQYKQAFKKAKAAGLSLEDLRIILKKRGE